MTSSAQAPKPAAKWYCYACGTPWPADGILCGACGGRDRADREARPSVVVRDDTIRFPFPWDWLPWPKQGTAVVIGGPGSGKSSLVLLVRPKVVLSREMEPKIIGALARRVQEEGAAVPVIRMVDGAESVARALDDVREGPIVIDSLTALGSMKDALLAAHLVDHWAKTHDDRAAAILQVNKSGEGAGYMQIPHLFDTIVDLEPDPWGVRAFRVTKSRWVGVGGRYWTFDEAGRISHPTFEAAYSVEGSPGNYWLHPYPMAGAKWAGILRVLDVLEHLEGGGVASAAIRARYMDSGFVQPPDHEERKRFALENSLSWIGPEDVRALLSGQAIDEQDPEPGDDT